MGGLLSLATTADGLSFLQDWHWGTRSEKFARLSYDLDFQGLRLDVLSTIREEIRDQVFVVASSLDNLMVVATLMLSIGFGFVVEGTFPPEASEALEDWRISFLFGFHIDPLVVYSILCALSLVCPFWSMILAIRMRYEVELIIREHMSELKKQLCNVLSRKEITAPDNSESLSKAYYRRSSTVSCDDVQRSIQRSISAPANEPIRCPKRFRPIVTRCPKRAEEFTEDVVNKVAQHIGPFTIPDETRHIEQEQILKWAEKDLLKRMRTYHFYINLAHFFLWMGMLCSVFTCAILLGIYFRYTFPNTQQVGIVYAAIVAGNGALAVVFALWMGFSCSNRDWCACLTLRANGQPTITSRNMSEPLMGDSSPRLPGNAGKWSAASSIRSMAFTSQNFKLLVREVNTNAYRCIIFVHGALLY